MQVMQRIQPHIVFLALSKDEQIFLEESEGINFQKFQLSVQKVILKITARKLSLFATGTFNFKIFKL